MTRVKTLFLIFPSIVFAIAACNLPTALGGQGTPSTVLKVSVSVATEYRTGPGQGYDLVGVLNPGQEVEAVGLSPDGEYLLVRDPANPVVQVWLKGDFATVKGNPALLPISTPLPTPTPVAGSTLLGNCPTPVGGGPTPVSCATQVDGSLSVGGCPTPVGGGPTPVSCTTAIGGPTVAGGCPTPVGGGPTPVSCTGGPTLVGGCPTPVGGGPTPVSCTGGPTLVGGCPTPIGGGPTPVSCRPLVRHPTSVGGPTLPPTLVK
jgi:hypothetical protein